MQSQLEHPMHGQSQKESVDKEGVGEAEGIKEAKRNILNSVSIIGQVSSGAIRQR